MASRPILYHLSEKTRAKWHEQVNRGFDHLERQALHNVPKLNPLQTGIHMDRVLKMRGLDQKFDTVNRELSAVKDAKMHNRLLKKREALRKARLHLEVENNVMVLKEHLRRAVNNLKVRQASSRDIRAVKIYFIEQIEKEIDKIRVTATS